VIFALISADIPAEIAPFGLRFFFISEQTDPLFCGFLYKNEDSGANFEIASLYFGLS